MKPLFNSTLRTILYFNSDFWIKQRNTDEEIANYHYTLDAVGNRIQIVEKDGRQSNYSYDPLYRLTQEEIIDPVLGNLTNTFTYDPVGNRLSQNSSTQGLTTYIYNANDQLLIESHHDVVTESTYDSNGNLLSRTSPTQQISYQWNYENRLIGATITDTDRTQQLEYYYSPEGQRVATIIDGVETRYLVDTNLSHSQVIEEYLPDGTIEAAYVYGLDLISQEREDSRSYYHVDGLGSTRLLTNYLGNITDSYSYDAHGNLLGSKENTINAYRYTGERFDSNLQEYYLRARHYNSSTGRFTSRDPFEGWLTDPLSLAKYNYVHGNPVNFTDPSGLLRETLTTLIVNNILAAFPSVGYTTALVLARATPIVVGSALVATYALADAYLATDVDEDQFNGLPVLFFTDRDLPMHRHHISNAQTGSGFTKSFYKSLRDGTPYFLGAQPIDSVLTYQGSRNAAPLNQAIDIRRAGDDALIARALSIRPEIFGGKEYYNIPKGSYARDEYPFATTEEGGPIHWANDRVSIAVVSQWESVRQGPLIDRFYLDPGVRLLPRTPLFSEFGVLASPVSNHNSGYIRRDGSKFFRS